MRDVFQRAARFGSARWVYARYRYLGVKYGHQPGVVECHDTESAGKGRSVDEFPVCSFGVTVRLTTVTSLGAAFRHASGISRSVRIRPDRGPDRGAFVRRSRTGM